MAHSRVSRVCLASLLCADTFTRLASRQDLNAPTVSRASLSQSRFLLAMREECHAMLHAILLSQAKLLLVTNTRG